MRMNIGPHSEDFSLEVTEMINKDEYKINSVVQSEEKNKKEISNSYSNIVESSEIGSDTAESSEIGGKTAEIPKIGRDTAKVLELESDSSFKFENKMKVLMKNFYIRRQKRKMKMNIR